MDKKSWTEGGGGGRRGGGNGPGDLVVFFCLHRTSSPIEISREIHSGLDEIVVFWKFEGVRAN